MRGYLELFKITYIHLLKGQINLHWETFFLQSVRVLSLREKLIQGLSLKINKRG